MARRFKTGRIYRKDDALPPAPGGSAGSCRCSNWDLILSDVDLSGPASDPDPLQNRRIWTAIARPTSARMAATVIDVPRPRVGFATPAFKAWM